MLKTITLASLTISLLLSSCSNYSGHTQKNSGDKNQKDVPEEFSVAPSGDSLVAYGDCSSLKFKEENLYILSYNPAGFDKSCEVLNLSSYDDYLLKESSDFIKFLVKYLNEENDQGIRNLYVSITHKMFIDASKYGVMGMYAVSPLERMRALQTTLVTMRTVDTGTSASATNLAKMTMLQSLVKTESIADFTAATDVVESWSTITDANVRKNSASAFSSAPSVARTDVAAAVVNASNLTDAAAAGSLISTLKTSMASASTLYSGMDADTKATNQAMVASSLAEVSKLSSPAAVTTATAQISSATSVAAIEQIKAPVADLNTISSQLNQSGSSTSADVMALQEKLVMSFSSASTSSMQTQVTDMIDQILNQTSNIIDPAAATAQALSAATALNTTIAKLNQTIPVTDPVTGVTSQTPLYSAAQKEAILTDIKQNIAANPNNATLVLVAANNEVVNQVTSIQNAVASAPAGTSLQDLKNTIESSKNSDPIFIPYNAPTSSSYAVCSSEGEVGCITSAAFKPIKVADLQKGNIKKGTSILGVEGEIDVDAMTATISALNSSIDGLNATIANQSGDSTALTSCNNEKVSLSNQLASKSSEYSSCESNLNFKTLAFDTCAADKVSLNTQLASKGADLNGCMIDLGIKTSQYDALNIISNQAMAQANDYSTELGKLNAGNLLKDVVINGITGSVEAESHSLCVGNGQTGCVTSTLYKSADLSNLIAGNIKFGVEIAGVAGSQLCSENALSCGSTPHMGTTTITKYQAASVPYGSSCVADTQTVSCYNGDFSPYTGSYTFDVCTITAGLSCDGSAYGLSSTMASDTSLPVVSYPTDQVAYGTCNTVKTTQTATCANGTISGVVWTNRQLACNQSVPSIIQMSNNVTAGGVFLGESYYYINGNDLMKSGDAVPIKTFAPNPDEFATWQPYPKGLIAAGNKMLFQAFNGSNYEVWMSDGTAAGTSVVYTQSGNTMYPDGYGWILSGAGQAGGNIWYTVLSSDGPDKFILGSMDLSSGLTNIGNLAPIGNHLFYTATDSYSWSFGLYVDDMRIDSKKLYVCDDYELMTGCHEETTLYPSGFDSRSGVVDIGGVIYFGSDNSLYKYDPNNYEGGGAGLEIVKNLGTDAIDRIIKTNGSMYLISKKIKIWTGSQYLYTYKLWTSDGTAAGTVMVKDLDISSIQSISVAGSSIYFIANYDNLWKSDGTASGTLMVKDISSGTTESQPQNLTVVGNTLYFTATDEVHGHELWRSDGTEAGTFMIKDIRPGNSPYIPYMPYGSYPTGLVASGTLLYFIAADNDHGFELWRSDGSEAGTVMVADLMAGSNQSNITIYGMINGSIYFVADTYGNPSFNEGRSLFKIAQ
jgi:ELWxxDGT repeat protein